MGVIKLWGDEEMGKIRDIFGMNVGPEEVGAGTYERALNIAKKTLNNMGYPTSN